MGTAIANDGKLKKEISGMVDSPPASLRVAPRCQTVYLDEAW
jgi:hypothetical protein